MESVPSATETLVIGGGPGGYVAAIRAGQLGGDVLLVEKEAVGGVCLNHGCIPSKALLDVTGDVHRIGQMEAQGVYADPYLDMDELVEWKDGVVDRLTGGVESLLQRAGVTVVDGTGRFVDDSTVAIDPSGAGDEPQEVTFEHAVVATGSRPVELPDLPFSADPILSSRDALDLDSVPNRLAVVGAGYIGMELATVFAKAGTDVTVLEALDRALPNFDEDVGAVVADRADELGIEFHFEATVDGWEPAPDGRATVTATSATGDAFEVTADAVLVAIGREPVAETVDPAAAGIERDENGFISTDEYGATSTDGIYAVGDVAGEPMLAHEASQRGIAVAETIDGTPTTVDPMQIPAAVFTDPEIATVGYSPEAATEAGHDVTIGRFPFASSGRAMTAGAEEGFVEVVVDDDDGTILGAQVVGEHASELVGELSLAVSAELTAAEVAATVHTHPTLSETIKEACEAALGRAIHTSN